MRYNSFVLDANVYISFAITNNLIELSDIVTRYELIVFSCDELLTEVKRVLEYPHLKHYNIKTKELINFINILTTNHSLQYPIKRYVPNDPDDDYIIALALQTNSGFVTSGDKDILDNKLALEAKFKKLKIITLRHFKDMYRL